MRQRTWANETFPNNTRQYFNNRCWSLDRIGLNGLRSLHMCLSRKLSMLFLMQPALPVKSTPHCRRNQWQNYWCGRESRGLRTCTHLRCMRAATTRGGHATLSYAPIFGSLHSTNSGKVFSPTRLSIHSLTSTVRAIVSFPRSTVEGRRVPVSLTRWLMAWNVGVRKSRLRIPLCVHLTATAPLSLLGQSL
jgi:hypothetical protein